ncbi:DNA polymerase III, subunit gamma and tau [Bifidobacterium aemilianum]|uniref:DNA-directed DNA polymerase n=1 Tax=Bifidobacterium aemilianum TaxID=2493120 RepID=A0A366K673_9BIFI|nr:DNA polymerase III subunit gamma and tau [Bifidobacterium aemilianum]RBP97246.1 DNA polymerase III, subunit gamma and tau [Bifidobacterium aemilianum]
MALALYRRYRPDTFDGVIGQDQVTVPLSRALDAGRLTHAYLFSGPRGCGKTSSARILARCINCEQGPTSHPCGECASCKDLATGGAGSIDVVEIDAASHNGVDDARELRERAAFAPARDRYKIFILDEAHMVTQQGFNALLKIVEEPPEHVMFIFATTEPEKVIGTIRSRTHHYPFRLVPEEIMGPYLEEICQKEDIKSEPGVLKLTMRAGGGSVRDTLSVLDQLMVGAKDGVIAYDAAVALLGFTPEALIGEAMDAVIDSDGAKLYGVVQQVVVGGFDPRRFVEDMLARVRDLLVLNLGGEQAEHVLSDDAAAENLEDLQRQASALGLAALSSMAETVNESLSSMAGATSPRMRLELLAAQLLAARQRQLNPSQGFQAVEPGPQAQAGQAAGENPSAPTGVQASTRGQAGFAGASRQQRQGFAGATRQGEQPGNTQIQAPEQGQATAKDSSAVPLVQAKGQESTGPAAVGAPVGQIQQAGSAQGERAGEPAPATPAAEDTRTADERWDEVLSSLPEDIRQCVDRDKVPTISFNKGQAGKARLAMTFDCALSQHAFAFAVASDQEHNGKKASHVVLEAVRKVFGPHVMIAPTTVAANGEHVMATSRMTPEQLAQVKKEIALAKAGLAAASLSQAAGGHAGSQSKEPKSAAAGKPGDADDPTHRAPAQADRSSVSNDSETAGSAPDGVDAQGQSESGHAQSKEAAGLKAGDPSQVQPQAVTAVASPASSGGARATSSSDEYDDDDPWFGVAAAANKPEPAKAEPAHEHVHKQVAVPDPDDDYDPWADQPVAEAPAQPEPANAGAGQGFSESSTAAWDGSGQAQSASGQAGPAATGPTATVRSAGGGEAAFASHAPGPHSSVAHPDVEPDDPYNPTGPAEPMGSAGPAGQNCGRPEIQQVESQEDPWMTQAPNGRRPLPNPSTPAGQGKASAGDVEDPAEDEYSIDDESLEDASSMSLEDLTKFFDVKSVEEFAADDPHNPKNLKPPHRHQNSQN